MSAQKDTTLSSTASAHPIALQLYTVRDVLARDFAGVVRRIATMGYAGVEPAGFPGTTPREAKKLFDDLGLAVPAAHTRLPVGEQKNEVLEIAAELDCGWIVAGRRPDDFKSLDLIKESCEAFNEAAQAAASQGRKFAIHNHWWEFEKLDGRLIYQIMLEYLDPSVDFEVDTYWVKTAGADPVAVIKELGERAPLLHIKDGPAVKDQPMMAVGKGVMEFPPIIAAGGENVQWLIVELDRCATNMMEAVEESYSYLTRTGLGKGAL